jgi:hypothetical protein
MSGTEAGMKDSSAPEGAIGLAAFLSDLRAELAQASRNAKNDPLKLGVDQVTVSLDVAVTKGRKGGASAGVRARFWVFASASAQAQAQASSERMQTQHLTLTLRPRLETIETDSTGRQRRTTSNVDVAGTLAPGEEDPPVSHAGRSRPGS